VQIGRDAERQRGREAYQGEEAAEAEVAAVLYQVCRLEELPQLAITDDVRRHADRLANLDASSQHAQHAGQARISSPVCDRQNAAAC
jgi:hypothetical protein